MKKIWLIAVILCSLLLCGICSAAPAKQQGMVIETDYYTITVPASWKTDCVYEHGEQIGFGAHTLTVYDKSSRKQTEHGLRGGELFSICLGGVYDNYTGFSRYQHLGCATVDGVGYNIVVIYPSYREYTPRTEAKYKEMQKQIPAIIKSIKYKKGVIHSDEVVPVSEPEIEQAYEDEYDEEVYEEEVVEEVPQEEKPKETIVDKAKKEISSFLGKLFKKK